MGAHPHAALVRLAPVIDSYQHAHVEPRRPSNHVCRVVFGCWVVFPFVALRGGIELRMGYFGVTGVSVRPIA